MTELDRLFCKVRTHFVEQKSGDIRGAAIETYSVPASGRMRNRPYRLTPLELVN